MIRIENKQPNKQALMWLIESKLSQMSFHRYGSKLPKQYKLLKKWKALLETDKTDIFL